MHFRSLTDRVAAAEGRSAHPPDLAALLRAVSRQPVRRCFSARVRSIDEAEEPALAAFFREDFPPALYQDGDMTWLEAARYVDRLETDALTEEGSEALNQFFVCLLDVALLCGERG